MKKYFLLAATVLAVGTATTIQTETNLLGNLFVQSVKADEQTLTPTANYYIVLPEGHEEFKNYKGTAEKIVIPATDKTPALYYIEETDVNYIQNLNAEGKNFQEWKGSLEEFKEAISKLSDKKVGEAEKPTEQKPKPVEKTETKPTEQKPAEKTETKPAEQNPEEKTDAKQSEQKPVKVDENKETKRTIPETDLGVSAGLLTLFGALSSTVIGKKIKD